MKRDLICYLTIFILMGCSGVPYSRLADKDLQEWECLQIIKELSSFIEHEQNNWKAYYLRGTAYYRYGDLVLAIDDFSSTIKLNPMYSPAYSARGHLYFVMNKYDEALIDMNNAISFDTNNSELYYSRAVIYYNLKNYIDADNDLDYAIGQDANNVKYLLFKALIYSEMERYDETIALLRKTAEIDEYNYIIYYELGVNFYLKKDYREALNYIEQAIKLNVVDAESYNIRGLINEKLDNNEDALNDYSMAIKLSSQRISKSKYYYNRGYLYFSFGSYQNAILDFDKAIEINVTFKNAYRYREEIYRILSEQTEDDAMADMYMEKAESDHIVLRELENRHIHEEALFLPGLILRWSTFLPPKIEN